MCSIDCRYIECHKLVGGSIACSRQDVKSQQTQTCACRSKPDVVLAAAGSGLWCWSRGPLPVPVPHTAPVWGRGDRDGAANDTIRPFSTGIHTNSGECNPTSVFSLVYCINIVSCIVSMLSCYSASLAWQISCSLAKYIAGVIFAFASSVTLAKVTFVYVNNALIYALLCTNLWL